MPSGQVRASCTPIISRKPEVQMRQGATNSDVANGERTRRTVRFRFEPVKALCGLEAKRGQVCLGLRLAWTAHLSEAEYDDLHQAVTEGLAPQRLPAQIRVGGKQLRSIVQTIEILADDPRVVERRPVVEHQGRDLAEGVACMTSLLGLFGATTTRCVRMRSAMPTSCAVTITLRTNGERDDQ